MQTKTTEISIEQLLKLNGYERIQYNNDIVMISNINDIKLFSHPARLKATTVLICINGNIECSINLKRFTISKNQILVNFSSDIIQIHKTHDLFGYVILLSDNYLQQLQLDFKLRVQSYIGLRGNGPIQVPLSELKYLRPYYTLFKKNMIDGNSDSIKGLTLALSYTILSMVRHYKSNLQPDNRKDDGRAVQIFDNFMSLLKQYHNSDRTLQFYADKMCLTPKYVSMMIKDYSGKCALNWINEYVIIEAKMMLRYTTLTIQEISNRLNFPTQSAFGKYFKRQVGLGPKQYRTNTLN